MSPGRRPRRNGNFPPKKKKAPARTRSAPRNSKLLPSSRKGSILGGSSPRTARIEPLGCDGDSLHQVCLFVDVFGADGKRIQNPKSQGIAKRLVLFVAHISLAKDFHSHNSL